MNDKEKFEPSGEELVSLACSFAIALSKKYEGNDLNKIKLFFQSVVSNLTIIEIQNLNKNK